MWKSREKNETIDRMRALICRELAGKRLILGSCGGTLRDRFVQTLVHLIEQSGIDLELHNGVTKAQADDYVLLFGENTEPGHSYEELLMLGEELQILSGKKTQSVLFLSDHAVYGVCFGEQKLRKEEEIGYVSHTSAEGGSIQRLRMAEHLVCRAAHEDGVHAKAVRACGPVYEEDAETLVLETLLVLLYGADGEIYNLPSGHPDKEECDHSPLSPIQVIPDTEKYMKLQNNTIK